MDTTATIGELLAEEFPDGCTGLEAAEFMKGVGHIYGGSAAADLKRMGSNLGSGAGGGVVKSSATRGQKIRSGQRRPKGINK